MAGDILIMDGGMAGGILTTGIRPIGGIIIHTVIAVIMVMVMAMAKETAITILITVRGQAQPPPALIQEISVGEAIQQHLLPGLSVESR